MDLARYKPPWRLDVPACEDLVQELVRVPEAT
jgi:hypothetical protein